MFGASLLFSRRSPCPDAQWIPLLLVLRQPRPFTPCSPFKCDTRAIHAHISTVDEAPFRKQLKDRLKQKRAILESAAGSKQAKIKDSKANDWELTVGIEIHAQLNTERKLFSDVKPSINDRVNSRVAFFDLALPGTQPNFQKRTLVPALRAATAFGCDIKRRSRFDRKHYFYQDQPAGYQITQYYEPFAKDGSITLYSHDGIAQEDGDSIEIGIKQIQMEQDTAKTIQQPPTTTLLDFNRVSHPLIEIITLPQIHHPKTAAACVKKIQSILQAVNAVTMGMEMGGLRADVNVSVKSKIIDRDVAESSEYYGITGLGQRTEIKNLSSLKAVEDAVAAERDRQIDILESGGTIQGETRGWTLGQTETRKLRGKEGEVDYRYMPDPDLPPLFIGGDLIDHISVTLPKLPDHSIRMLVEVRDLTLKDAKTLVALDDGARLDYYDEVLAQLECLPAHSADKPLEEQRPNSRVTQDQRLAKTAANWVIHELGGLFSKSKIAFSDDRVSATAMASILRNLTAERITGRTAKMLLALSFDGDSRTVNNIIESEDLELVHLSQEQYLSLAQGILDENSEMVEQIQNKGQLGKIHWFVGQMMQKGQGKVTAGKAEATLTELLGINIT